MMSLFMIFESVCFCGNSDPRTYIERKGEDGTTSGRQCMVCDLEWTTENIVLEGNVDVDLI